jgi:hypothetical protein
MLRVLTALLALELAAAAAAAERKFDFSQTKENETPAGFRSLVSGEGQPGQWKVIRAEVPAALPALYSNSPVVAQQAALAQLARDPAEEHFPLLVFEEETFGDFTFTTRLKTVSGQTAQMAGLAFRIQDEKNYYVARVSSTGNNVQFYKFVGGVRSVPIGPEIAVPKDVWHELSVDCKGNQITVSFNGKQVMPVLSDSSFVRGRVGFWTKSDSVSYFAEPRITYTLREKFATVLVRDVLKKHTQVRRLKLYALTAAQDGPRVIAGGNAADLGQAGGQEERTCLQDGTPYFGRTQEEVIVLLPVRDRNGDIVAAVKVYMATFFGQTEQNALNRARPVAKFMEGRLVGSNEPLQ